MRREVHKIPSSAYLGPDTPSKSGGVQIIRIRRLQETDLYAPHVSNGTGIQQRLHPEERGEGPTVVRHVEGHPGFFAHRYHAQAFFMCPAHGLFHEHRLPRHGCAGDILLMSGGWRGNVDSIDIGIAEQCLRPVVPLRHSMPQRIIVRPGTITAHHGHQPRTRHALEGGTTLHFSHVAAADDPPPHLIHVRFGHACHFSDCCWPGIVTTALSYPRKTRPTTFANAVFSTRNRRTAVITMLTTIAV